MKYLTLYPLNLQKKVKLLLDKNQLGDYLLNKYPQKHTIQTDKGLYNYVLNMKNDFMQKSKPISKVHFDNKIHVLKDALGTHTYISRVQGSKLKSKNEIRISSIFKSVPDEFLRMIVVHELAHLKEKEHDKAFYKLCLYMEPHYHQYEFDMRVYLTYMDAKGKLY